MHFVAASDSFLNNSFPQVGQQLGKLNLLDCLILSSFITFTTSGIISPAFLTTTVSNSWISSCSNLSKLCKVALDTVVPANCTGSKLATGVTFPDRPT